MTEDAATEAGVSSPVGFRWFRHAGGVNPRLQESVSGRYLSSGEREDIALWRAQGAGVREIGRRLGRAPSTVSRELRRNASTRTYRLDYKASVAQWHAERRARRPKTAKLVSNDRLCQYVQEKLSGVVRGADGQVVPGPSAPQWKGRNKPRDLVTCLRRGRALRVPRARARQTAWAHVTPETLISQRPPEVADRTVPGHWEQDMLIGLQRSAIGTLVECSSRFTMLIHLPREHNYGLIPRTKNGPALAGYGALTMAGALAQTITRLPEELRRSLTWDRGKELSAHAQFSIASGVKVYFADPKSPWQRGTNENTYWCTVLGPDGFDGSQSGGLLGDSENTCRTWLSVDLSTAA
jgi:IS30 family transposase